MLYTVSRYALCYVAIYGSDLRTAGKETWELFARRGWAAIINDQVNYTFLALVTSAAQCCAVNILAYACSIAVVVLLFDKVLAVLWLRMLGLCYWFMATSLQH
jgi:Plasma-membrane choline transporter